jgi:eukaryotic-like serine/threonine-protein kinase
MSEQHQKAQDQREMAGGQTPGSVVENRQSKTENTFGDYDFLEPIGQGGMGVVYRARQRSLDRVVAIKMMAFGSGSSPEFVQRFRAEAVSAASLHHPNIVAIHEVGVHEGRHFFVMDYIEGQSLARLVGNEPLPAKRAAGYLKTIAEAVHYAHERGILHRDLKPANVLIDAEDQPHIVDFGLARRLDDSQLSTLNPQLTVTGQVLGSPHYLPPEQATGQRAHVSRRTDVYALGATLYHLLTGRPPFQAESLAQTLDLVLHAEPISPRLLNPSVPRDLETICLKCLEKERSRRYPTAQALADELGLFLANEPIQARPLGPGGKVWRWCRRKPQVASLAGAVIVTFLLGFAGVLWQWREAEAERRRAEHQAYVSDINAAQAAVNDNNPARALELLNRSSPSHSARTIGASSPAKDLRGFEWRYLWQQCQSDAEALVGRVASRINSLEVSRDGHWLVAASDAGDVKLWNLLTGEEIPLAPDAGWPNYATFSPDSRLVLHTDQTFRSRGSVIAWDIPGRKRLAPVYQHGLPVGVVGFSGDGRWFEIGAIRTNASALTPDGTTPAAALADRSKQIILLECPGWNRTRELSLSSPQAYMDKGLDWVFTADNRSVIYAETEPVCQLALWDFVAGAKPRGVPAHNEGITAMAISPDGRLLATGSGYSDTVIRLWEVPSLRSVRELSGHAAWIAALKFSRDGRTLVSASADKTIRLWSMATKEATRIYRGMAAEPSRLCLGLSDEKVFSGGSDGTVWRWPAVSQPAQPPRGSAPIKTGLESAAVSPSGAEYAGIREGSVYLGNVKPDASPIRLPALGTNNNCLLFSPQQHLLFAGTWNGMVQVWSLADHRIQASLRGAAEPVYWLGQDRRGSIMVAVHWNQRAIFQNPPAPHTVSVWNTANWQPRVAFSIPGIGAHYAVSPDGNFLAVGRHVLGKPQVWNLGDPRQTNMLTLPGWVEDLAFSPDGRRLAAVTLEGRVGIWEVPGFHPRPGFRAAPGGLFALAFSPDTRRLVTARAGTLQVWDVATWEQLVTLESPRGISRAAFTPEGNQLAAVSDGGNVVIWRVPSFEEIEAKEKGQSVQ